MKKLLLVLAFGAGGAFAQCGGAWADFSALTASSNLSGAVNAKLNFQCGSGAPSGLNGTVGKDAYIDTAGGNLYLVSTSGSPATWKLIGGLTSLNGLTGATQTFAFGSSGTTPNVASSGTTHTFNFPLASVSGVTAGLIPYAFYNTILNTAGSYTDPAWLSLTWTGGRITGIPTFYYQTVQANTTAQTQRANLNFSSNFALSDSSGSNRTTVDLAATINSATSGNAATATAFASLPSLCSSGQAPTGILANGNATGCAVLGSGTVSTTGTPTSGTLAKFTGSTTVGNAGYADVFSLFSGCSGSMYPGFDGACHSAAGSGTVTSVNASFTGGILSVAGGPVTTSGTLAVTLAGTSGGIPYFSSASTWASSAALTANGLMIGGGPGAAPSTISVVNNAVVSTNGSGVPSELTTLPTGLAMQTPASLTLTNATGLPINTGVSGLATGMATFLATPSSADLLGTLTTSTGNGLVVFGTGPTLTNATLVTPALGTPTSGVLTNATGLPISTGVSGLGTGIEAFLAGPSNSTFQSISGLSFTGSAAAAIVLQTSPTITSPLILVNNSFSAGTITANHLACMTASNTVGNCAGLPSNNILGVFDGTTGNFVQAGTHTVVLDATVSVNYGDILCGSSTSAGTAHDNGSTACTTGEWVGIVQTTAGSVSSATAILRLQ